MEPTDPPLLADSTLRCGMYPAGKVAISQHLATSRFTQCSASLDCVVKYSRPPDPKSSSNVSLPFAWITGPKTEHSLIPQSIETVQARIILKLFFNLLHEASQILSIKMPIGTNGWDLKR